MTKREARDTRTVLRALSVVSSATRDLPEVLVPAYRLDQRAMAALATAQSALPASWRVKAIALTSTP